MLRRSSDGAVARALASHKCRPRLIPARCHIMWVEFAVGSRLVPNYRELQQANSTRIDDPHKNQLRLIWIPLQILDFLRELHTCTRISKDFLKYQKNDLNQYRPRYFVKMIDGCQKGTHCFWKFNWLAFLNLSTCLSRILNIIEDAMVGVTDSAFNAKTCIQCFLL